MGGKEVGTVGQPDEPIFERLGELGDIAAGSDRGAVRRGIGIRVAWRGRLLRGGGGGRNRRRERGEDERGQGRASGRGNGSHAFHVCPSCRDDVPMTRQ